MLIISFNPFEMQKEKKRFKSAKTWEGAANWICFQTRAVAAVVAVNEYRVRADTQGVGGALASWRGSDLQAVSE